MTYDQCVLPTVLAGSESRSSVPRKTATASCDSNPTFQSFLPPLKRVAWIAHAMSKLELNLSVFNYVDPCSVHQLIGLPLRQTN